MRQTITIGTRASTLALKQVDELMPRLLRVFPETLFQIVPINTIGDKKKHIPLESLEGTDFFTKEIEEALSKKTIDMAVHSAKDLPDTLKKGLTIGAILKPIDQHDTLVAKNNYTLNSLPRNAKIGTSSIRRREQLLKFRADFSIHSIRGTIEERLTILDNSDLDAIIVANAALIRLDLTHRISQTIPFDIMQPHPLQGTLAIEIRKNDTDLKNKLFTLHEDILHAV